MFTLIKEEVNSTFLLFDKFIDHRCCERVLSVFLNQVQGKRSKGGSNPKLIFALSLSLFFSGILGAALNLTCCYIKDQHVFGSVGCFFGSYGCFSDDVFFIFCRQVGPTSNLSGLSFLYLYQAAIFCCHPHHLLSSQYYLVWCLPKESSRDKISLTILFWAFLLFQCSETSPPSTLWLALNVRPSECCIMYTLSGEKRAISVD